MIHRTPAERTKHFQRSMGGWILGLFTVNSVNYFFGGSFLLYLPFYVLTIFGMLMSFLTELLEILLYEIKSTQSAP